MKPTNTAKPEMKLSMPAVKRLLSYLRQYKTVLAVVTVCILISASATAAASLFLQTLIDRYITPLLAQSTPVFTGLLRALIFMGAVYGTGVLCSWIYNRLMKERSSVSAMKCSLRCSGFLSAILTRTLTAIL